MVSERDPHAAALFRARLLPWYADHGRPFPWRGEADPYRVLIAERMLHRTRAEQVVGAYRSFLARYPTAWTLARADPAGVHELLAPLGLAWRFASFVPMAQRLVDEHDGQVPRTRAELLALPGVGPYVADAVLCFAFGEAVAVVDTNTIRVAGRYLRGAAWVADERKRRDVRTAVAGLLDPDRPAASNHATLDLGASICMARTALCSRCPVREGCMYGRRNVAGSVPARTTGGNGPAAMKSGCAEVEP